MFRVTKKGGLILITVPFLGGLHEEPNDYQRYTRYGLKELVKEYGEILEIEGQGSVLSTISMLLNESLNSFASRNKTTYLISMLIYLPFLTFQYLSLFLDFFIKSDKIQINYLLLVRKK
mgnify:CR=1 FL=1